ncbi:PIN domain-containing protein [Rhizobium sp. 1399]|uniref:type II toxin-antitoxin system VapC family toxin n=1 Tax=Rhizobium sp. 1399 TaxID=2817758 RepID=UPI00285F1726|nr:PIN domain-containing protein [Rhizobium sp. 1399]MDR6670164.1 putative nucleic acid-binding protein [Rhizobium sp. 1399]
MNKIPAYYWDSCVFIAHFNNERDRHNHLIDHIEQHLKEAQAGKCQIYTSTLTIAEITTPTLNAASVGSFNEFVRDFQSSIFLMEPDPNTMTLASHLRSQRYSKQDGAKPRQLSPPDAIHLATAINLKPMYNVELDAFHTFDAGKSRGLDGGRGLPMLGFEEWAAECSQDIWVKRVCDMRRSIPEHPTPQLNLG